MATQFLLFTRRKSLLGRSKGPDGRSSVAALVCLDGPAARLPGPDTVSRRSLQMAADEAVLRTYYTLENVFEDAELRGGRGARTA